MSRTVAVSTAVVLLAFQGNAGAVLTDHLQCYTIKDPQPKATYTATLTPSDNAFPVAPGCTIKVPAKLLCIDVEKSGVTPPPPGAGPGAQAQKYLCYKTKCPKLKQTNQVQDQFGTRIVKVSMMNMMCAPFPAPTTTTTTTTSTTSTTSTTIFTCATNSQCPAPPNAQGICMAGQCQPGFTCLPGYANCNGLSPDGCEVGIASDPNNCGGCGLVCPPRPNAVAVCNAMTCGFACNAGFADCDAAFANGCEVSLVNNPNDCGGCGNVCPPAMPTCVGTSCQ